LVILEVSVYERFSLSRAYLASLIFLYLILKAIDFWAGEYYRYFGPSIIRASSNLKGYDLTKVEAIFYTAFDREGKLKIKDQRNASKDEKEN
jgi:hypothetical protein